jgi:hypothetical protein
MTDKAPYAVITVDDHVLAIEQNGTVCAQLSAATNRCTCL